MSCRWSLSRLPEAPRPFPGLVAVEQPKGRLCCLHACLLQCRCAFVLTRLYTKIGLRSNNLGIDEIIRIIGFLQRLRLSATFRNVSQ